MVLLEYVLNDDYMNKYLDIWPLSASLGTDTDGGRMGCSRVLVKTARKI